jgi:hypothetical protein
MQIDPIATLILGAALGFASSAITAYLSHRYEERRAERTRDWALKDEKRNLRRQTLRQRIDLAEKYVRDIYQVAMMLVFHEGMILAARNSLKPDEELAELLRMEPAVQSAMQDQVHLLVLNDDKLTADSNAMLGLLGQELEHAKMLRGLMADPLFRYEDALAHSREFAARIAGLHAQILAKLDELASR